MWCDYCQKSFSIAACDWHWTCPQTELNTLEVALCLESAAAFADGPADGVSRARDGEFLEGQSSQRGGVPAK